MATFCSYRRLAVGIPVRFGKRGSAALAVGIGDVLIRGVAGELMMTDVLHVPELVGNLFSVSAAVQRGASVHFDPPAAHGGPPQVRLLHKGKVCASVFAGGDLLA